MKLSIPTVAFILAGVTASPACGLHPPAPGAGIDRHLSKARVSAEMRQQVRVARSRVAQLHRQGQEAEARREEERAMALLHYRKVWLRCGPGSHTWVRA